MDDIEKMKIENNKFIVEISKLKLASGVSDDEFLKEEKAVQINFYEKQEGYMSSELLKGKGNQWVKITHWNSMEAVRNAGKASRNPQSDVATTASAMPLQNDQP